MAIPDFEGVMRPLLAHLSDGQERGTRETLDALASEFKLNDDERRQPLPSGKQPLFTNRVAWAKFYLKKAGLIESPRRGVYRIMDRGKTLLASHAGPIDVRTLQQFSEFRDFLLGSPRTDRSDLAHDQTLALGVPPERPKTVPERTPEEYLEIGYGRVLSQLATEVLERVKAAPPEFFEHLVVDLLLALGYGGSRRDAGETIGKSGDGGVDGVIKEDPLGLDTIYVQAKRWDAPVGRPEVQKFAGALQGQRSRKGVLITTSGFTAEAKAFASNIDARIILLDGSRLTQLMIEHNIGVTPAITYVVKRVDSDYFSDE
jgi:restriction system protein